MEEVDYQVHYQQYAAQFIIEGNTGNNRFFEQQAQEMHVLGVSQAVDRLTTDALLLLPMLGSENPAERLFRFGVMRRWRMIAASFREFRSIVTPARVEPLSLLQADKSCRSLNAIYIDLHGLLDNYAWTLVHLVGSEKSRNAKPMAISIFSQVFRTDPNLSSLAEKLSEFEAWQSEFKDRRNPAAHRIPLHVPPAALSEADAVEHRRLDRLSSEALARGEFERASKISEATWKVGSFLPYFVHDPTEALMPIFPTLPTDIGQAVRIGRIIHDFLRCAGSSHTV